MASQMYLVPVMGSTQDGHSRVGFQCKCFYYFSSLLNIFALLRAFSQVVSPMPDRFPSSNSFNPQLPKEAKAKPSLVTMRSRYS
jgi:hypothetical protein